MQRISWIILLSFGSLLANLGARDFKTNEMEEHPLPGANDFWFIANHSDIHWSVKEEKKGPVFTTTRIENDHVTIEDSAGKFFCGRKPDEHFEDSYLYYIPNQKKNKEYKVSDDLVYDIIGHSGRVFAMGLFELYEVKMGPDNHYQLKEIHRFSGSLCAIAPYGETKLVIIHSSGFAIYDLGTKYAGVLVNYESHSTSWGLCYPDTIHVDTEMNIFLPMRHVVAKIIDPTGDIKIRLLVPNERFLTESNPWPEEGRPVGAGQPHLRRRKSENHQ